MSADRNAQMTAWVKQQLGVDQLQIEFLAGDASFRRYARVNAQGRQWIVMDAPTSHEDSRPFVGVDAMLKAHGVRVPHIVAHDLNMGFLVLEDFGNLLLSQVLTDDNVDALYGQAMNQLMDLQQAPAHPDWVLPVYDAERLTNEMRLFDQWFLPLMLERDLTDAEQQLLTQVYAVLADQAVAQPQVVVHRDYHCRNLMVLHGETELGIIDFQDAVIGPITYDVVSLLRDAYIEWPAERVAVWVQQFWQQSQIRGVMTEVSLAEFSRWFDLMGVQRQLKVLGIFVRLSQRDGKHGYMDNLPLVLAYVLRETRLHDDLAGFSDWLRQVVLPAFLRKLPAHAALLEPLH